MFSTIFDGSFWYFDVSVSASKPISRSLTSYYLCCSEGETFILLCELLLNEFNRTENKEFISPNESGSDHFAPSSSSKSGMSEDWSDTEQELLLWSLVEEPYTPDLRPLREILSGINRQIAPHRSFKKWCNTKWMKKIRCLMHWATWMSSIGTFDTWKSRKHRVKRFQTDRREADRLKIPLVITEELRYGRNEGRSTTWVKSS